MVCPNMHNIRDKTLYIDVCMMPFLILYAIELSIPIMHACIHWFALHMALAQV